MSDLSVDVKRTFGKYLPTSFIKKIDVTENPVDSSKFSNIEITVDVNFTVRPNQTKYKEAVREHLKDLYLYIAFCKHPGLVSDVQQKNLDLKKVFKWNSLIGPGTSLGTSVINTIRRLLTSAGVTATNSEIMQTMDINIRKIPLSNLADRIVEEGLYDISGDRILKISNIKHKTRFLNSVMSEQISKAAFFTFVGRDNNSIGKLPSVIFQRNFGDIAYEIALKYNVVPDTTQQIFVDLEGNQYTSGTPLRTMQGKYHVSDPISHAIIIDNMRNLISAYEATGETSSDLTQALTRLRYVLATSEDSIDLIERLEKYRKQYPDKSNATVAGRFYSLFRKKLVRWNRRVARQTRLYKRLILNSKTSDLRGVDLETYSVITPDPDPGLYFTGASPENYYINPNMINLNRTTQLTIPLEGAVSDFVQFAAEEGIDNLTDATALWNAKYDNMFAASLDHQYGAVDTTTGGSAMGSNSVPNQLDPLKDTDTVVKNKGLFFFDWERALHTKSAIAKVFRLHYLQKFLGMHIPYPRFLLKKAILARRERTFVTQNEEEFASTPVDDPGSPETSWDIDAYDWSGSDASGPWDIRFGGERTFLWDPEYALIEITANFNAAADYPEQTNTHWQIKCHQHESYISYGMPYVYKYTFGALDADTSSITDPINSNKDLVDHTYLPFMDAVNRTDSYLGPFMAPEYLHPYMHTANDSLHKSRSDTYLKLKNFDLPRRFEDRLDGYDGWRVSGGYRLMCFEFQDFMDDDVAYYNTIGSATGDRTKYWTKYEMATYIEDSSLQVYLAVKNLLEAEYLKFLEYYEKAKEICSYNNIDDVFNEFFISAMRDLESSSSTAMIWHRAPVIYYSFMAVITSMYSGLSMDEIPARIIDDASKTTGYISPMTGRMSELEAFKRKYEHLLGMFASNKVPVESWGPQARAMEELYTLAGGTIDGTPNPVFNLIFNQAHQITEPIYGNLYLSAWNVDDVDPNQLSNLEMEETPLDPDDNPFTVDANKADAHLMGLDLKLVCAKWWYVDYDEWPVKVKIYANVPVFWDGEFEFWGGTTPEGYSPGQELAGWEGGKIFSKKSSKDVYLPPGKWSIMFQRRDRNLSIEDGHHTKDFYISIDVEANSESKNRIVRSSGEGWEYTQAGIGPATFTWPMRNGAYGADEFEGGGMFGMDAYAPDFDEENEILIRWTTYDYSDFGFHKANSSIMGEFDNRFRNVFYLYPGTSGTDVGNPYGHVYEDGWTLQFDSKGTHGGHEGHDSSIDVNWSMYYLHPGEWYS